MISCAYGCKEKPKYHIRFFRLSPNKTGEHNFCQRHKDDWYRVWVDSNTVTVEELRRLDA